MFEVSDKVIYGVVGACEIVDVDTPPIKGIKGEYYFLQPVYDDKGIIYSPVDNNKVLIRSVMTLERCKELIDRASNCKNDDELNEKILGSQYDEYIKSQDAEKLMHLIRSLFNIKNQRAKDLRKMKSADSRMLLTARKLLYGEMAVALDQDMEEVSQKMDNLLSVL